MRNLGFPWFTRLTLYFSTGSHLYLSRAYLVPQFRLTPVPDCRVSPQASLKYDVVQLTLKLPILSARMPAIGGMMMPTTGVTADMMAVSSTFIPSSLMWMVKYGQSTNMAVEENWYDNEFERRLGS